jgi:hypothetical protein
MIHPFARFSGIPIGGETLWDKAARIERPAVEFAEFLKAGRSETPSAAVTATPMGAPRQIAAGINESRTLAVQTAPSPARSRTPPPADRPQSPVAAPAGDTAAGAALEGSPGAEDVETSPPADSAGPPHFPDVPDSAKYPAGPYRQAPAEFGGEWWLVNPFTGDEPWANQAEAASPSASPTSKYATENLPANFLQAFGEMPVRRSAESHVEYVGRVSRWKQDLEFFQGTGTPAGLDESQVELASNDYEQWGMGRPVFYEGRYGWFARFPDSAIPDFEMDAASAVQSPQLAIARFQVRLLREGAEVPTVHPYVPPHLLIQEA